MNQKITVLVLILALGLAGLYLSIFVTRENKEPAACTMEAKICPDGSAVGRTGPNCEFVACPSPASFPMPESQRGAINGLVLIGPTCPVEKYPPDPNCDDKPYVTRLVLTAVDRSRVIQEFSSTHDGTFSIMVSPGDYAIRSAAAANILPYCASAEVITVKANEKTEVVVSCDSGIR